MDEKSSLVRLDADGVASKEMLANYSIGDSVADVLKRADAALYVNKRRPKGSTATLPDSEQEAFFLQQ